MYYSTKLASVLTRMCVCYSSFFVFMSHHILFVSQHFLKARQQQRWQLLLTAFSTSVCFCSCFLFCLCINLILWIFSLYVCSAISFSLFNPSSEKLGWLWDSNPGKLPSKLPHGPLCSLATLFAFVVFDANVGAEARRVFCMSKSETLRAKILAHYSKLGDEWIVNRCRCDRIWRKFSTLAIILKAMAIFRAFSKYSAGALV